MYCRDDEFSLAKKKILSLLSSKGSTLEREANKVSIRRKILAVAIVVAVTLGMLAVTRFIMTGSF